MKLAVLLRIGFYGAALAMLVGLCGTTWVWLTSSGIRTDEHTHAYIFSTRGVPMLNPFYLTHDQNTAYWMYDSVLKYGTVVCLCLVAFIWVLQKIGKGTAQ